MARLWIAAGNLAIKIYRANPYRPHCNVAAGHHVRLCVRLGLNLKPGDCGGGVFGSSVQECGDGKPVC
jgi:hypothetical protein